MVFLLSFFPVVVSAVQGFRSIDPDIRDLARITGASPCACSGRCRCRTRCRPSSPASRSRRRWRRPLPSSPNSSPSDRGLGYLLIDYTNRFDTPGVFAAILVLSIMGLLLYAAVERWSASRFPGTCRNASTPTWRPAT